jgi:UDP-N-acetylmuramate dehydrogenase
VSDLRKAISTLHFEGSVRFHEPLFLHTSYRVGGPADAFLSPVCVDDVAEVMRLSEEIPVFILGAGANILVSDFGVRGIVLDMRNLSFHRFEGTTLVAGAGLDMSEAAKLAAQRDLAGLEFIYAMPGSVGGSVWMNARCYGRSVSDALTYADIVDRTGALSRIIASPDDFAYKDSPFQRHRWAIVEAGFLLRPGNSIELRRTMADHEQDRTRKGHFLLPSAGSVFKNNREFGEPSGKIIDSLGLRGTRRGGAMISEGHANIIVNTGTATAGEILQLIELAEGTVKDRLGFVLEREIRLVGDWPSEGDSSV